MHYVFVYGTLREGFYNHKRLEMNKEQKIGEGKTPPNFTLLDLGGLPAVVKGESVITGEVYQVTAKKLDYLDYLEGHPHFYRREQVDIVVGEAHHMCWMYKIPSHEKFIVRHKGQVVESGDWRKHNESLGGTYA